MPLKKKDLQCMEKNEKCIKCLKKCGEGRVKWAQPTTAAGKIKKSLGGYDISDCGCGVKCVTSKEIKKCTKQKGGRNTKENLSRRSRRHKKIKKTNKK